MNCIKVDTGWLKKKESLSTRNLEEEEQGRNENNREDMERNSEGSNGNLWSQPYMYMYVPPSHVGIMLCIQLPFFTQNIACINCERR